MSAIVDDTRRWTSKVETVEAEDVLNKLGMKRLESLQPFQEGAPEKTEQIEREVNARVRRAEERARGERTNAVIRCLLDYFAAKRDVPSIQAIKMMDACEDPATAQHWLRRAYAGEISAHIFPESTGNQAS